MFIREDNTQSSKTLILIHGQVFDSRIWDDAVPSFDARVLRPDLPGHGQSSGDIVVEFERQQERLEAVLLPLARGPVHLVGYSLGSYHALALALQGRLEVASLTMLGPWAGADRSVLENFAMLASAAEEEQLPWVDVFLGNCFSPTFAASHPATVALTRARIKQGSAAALVAELRRFPRMVDLRPRVSELKMPVLLRVGDADPTTTLASAQALMPELKKGTLQVAEGVAHHYLAQDPEGTVAAIRAFTGC